MLFDNSKPDFSRFLLNNEHFPQPNISGSLFAPNFRLNLYKDKNKESEFRWRVISTNGNIIADSGEGYRNKEDCLGMAKKILQEEISNNLQDDT